MDRLSTRCIGITTSPPPLTCRLGVRLPAGINLQIGITLDIKLQRNMKWKRISHMSHELNMKHLIWICSRMNMKHSNENVSNRNKHTQTDYKPTEKKHHVKWNEATRNWMKHLKHAIEWIRNTNQTQSNAVYNRIETQINTQSNEKKHETQ